ncbi:hypothetical protein BJX96DRAFT_157981 [Aspergillus floccosus]
MDRTVDPNQRDQYGSTPLSIAVRHAHVDVVRTLPVIGVVTCDSHDHFVRSVFWWAKRSGNADIEKMLTGSEEYRQKTLNMLMDGSTPRLHIGILWWVHSEFLSG